MSFTKHLFTTMAFLGLFAFSVYSNSAYANTDLLTEEDFALCIVNLSTKARNEGISTSVIDGSLAKAKLSPRVLELDRRQPEFTTTFADYFNTRVNEQRIQQGRKLLVQHRALLDKISRDYGVEPHYLVSFWGLETNFGSYFGKMQVLDSLATLACDTRRSDYFTGELMSALRIIDSGSLPGKSLEGSWAGAMGNMQFMPSVFLKYAVDYDADGKLDLWGSLPDAFASAANFLKGIGWKTGDRWGREVRLPDNFPYLEAGLNTRKPLTEWQKMGVRQIDGSALPSVDMQASLLVPASHKGPAFLVYHNFEVVMRWNRSEFYALAVGHLADRINGAGGLYRTPPEDAPRLQRDQVIALQNQLNEKGFDVGEADGILGPVTRRAIMQYQSSRNMIADGFTGPEVLNGLGVGFN